MSITPRLALAAALVAFVTAAAGCGGGEDPRAVPDASATPDAPGAVVRLPTWQLEDIQPQSPRTGQTYGLDTFVGKIVVVTLLEGF